MLIRATSLMLALALAGSVSLGVPLHSGDAECNIAEMKMGDCGHLGTPVSAIGGTALCCLLESQRPGPISNAPKLRVPSYSVPFVDQDAGTPIVKPLRFFARTNWLENTSSSSQYTYLKTRALLI